MNAPTTKPCHREPVTGHVQPEDFRHRAACRSVDPEVFFPTAVQGREFEQQVGIAKAVCAGCPVRPECLTWAITHLPDGIAGGMTEHERRLEAGCRHGARRRHRPRPQRPVGATRGEVAAAGRAALRAGSSVHEVAGEFLVSERTAARWAQSLPSTENGTSGGGPGCNRAHHLVSHTNPLAGTRAEGHRG